MKIKVDFRHDERTAIVNYLKAKEEKAKAEKAEKVAKDAVKAIFATMGKALKSTDKSEYAYGTIQVQGQAKAVVYRETTAQGTIDWQAYAMALGGNLEDAENFRKVSNVRTSLDWATDKQMAEISEG